MRSCASEKGGSEVGGLGGFEEAGGKADFAPNYLRLASARSCSASVDRKCRPRRSPNTLRNGDTFAVSYPRARRVAGGCRQGSDAHRGHRASRDRQRGGLGLQKRARVDFGARGPVGILRLEGGRECSENVILHVISPCQPGELDIGGSTRVHPAQRALGASGHHRSPPSEGAWWRRTRAGVTIGAAPPR